MHFPSPVFATKVVKMPITSEALHNLNQVGCRVRTVLAYQSWVLSQRTVPVEVRLFDAVGTGTDVRMASISVSFAVYSNTVIAAAINGIFAHSSYEFLVLSHRQ